MIRTFLNRSRLSQTKRLILFAGQGTQQIGMLDPLLKMSEAQEEIQRFSHLLGVNLIQVATAITSETQKAINQTQITQPLLVMTHYLFAKYVIGYQLSPSDTMIGHSVGEYSALVLAGSIGIEDCLKIVQKRGELMNKQSVGAQHGMLIIRFSDKHKALVYETIEKGDKQKQSIACYNAPNNIIVAGEKNALEQIRNVLKKEKVSSLFLPVSTAFHCPLLEGMKKPYSDFLSAYTFQTPACTIYRNIDSQKYTDDSSIKEGLIEHLTRPVQFCQSVEKWYNRTQGAGDILQLGHKYYVKNFAADTLAALSARKQ